MKSPRTVRVTQSSVIILGSQLFKDRGEETKDFGEVAGRTGQCISGWVGGSGLKRGEVPVGAKETKGGCFPDGKR